MRNGLGRLMGVGVVAIGLGWCAGAWAAKYEWKHEKGAALSLLADGKPVWAYHYAPEGNHPYFGTVCVPGGPNMAAFQPGDHLWHKGLWFSWKFINDVNFWDWITARGDNPKWPLRPPRTPDGWSKMQGKEEVVTSEKGAVIEMTVGYGRGEKTWIKEARRLEISRPDKQGKYTIDWRSTFTVLEEKMVFDRAPVQPTTGGYAGLGFRAPAEAKEMVFTNSLGTTGQACRGQKATWVDMTGVFGPQAEPTGVAIFDHPTNPRHPTPWHVQAKSPNFYINPALLYEEPLTLEAGKSITLRYRILVHKGKVGAEELNKTFETYAKGK